MTTHLYVACPEGGCQLPANHDPAPVAGEGLDDVLMQRFPFVIAEIERWWADRWVAQFLSDGSGRQAAAEMTARANELGPRTE